MTEQEWLTCTDPTPMLEFLRGKTSERKLRLFACACCRRVWNLLTDRYSRKALAVAERYADAEVSAEKLSFAWGDARRAAQVVYRQERQTADAGAMWAVSALCEGDIDRALQAIGQAAGCEAYPDPSRSVDAQREQLHLLRDIFGNPFRSTVVDSAWQTPTIVALTHAAYDNRILPAGVFDPARLAVLADALEESGADAEILGHLRCADLHVRGCWAVDLVLAKE